MNRKHNNSKAMLTNLKHRQYFDKKKGIFMEGWFDRRRKEKLGKHTAVKHEGLIWHKNERKPLYLYNLFNRIKLFLWKK
jgi:hypothetical protein